MTKKFGRNFRLVIYPIDGGESIIVTMPFTIKFALNRDIGSKMNALSIDIYNLSEEHRSRIFQDFFALGDYKDSAGGKRLNADGLPTFSHNIILEIGYETLYRVYYGRMVSASSAREGTNIVTHIEALDGELDVAGTQVFQTLDGEQTVSSVMKFLIGQFPTLDIGAVGEYPDKFLRPVALNGNVWNLLKKYSDGQVYIDSGRVYVLKNRETLAGFHVLDDASGLLETPRREQAALQITTLMDAAIQIADQVKIESSIQKEYNGTYKVVGVQHQGVISAAVCQNMVSRFRLLAPDRFYGFTVVPLEDAAK